MGIACSSRTSTSVATAKVVLDDGQLRKFSCPVKASQVLEKLNNESSNNDGIERFICNSDDMEYGGLLTAIDDEDELQPNQIYFSLPMKWLKRRITAQDMVALAVKASSAIEQSGSGRGGWCRGKAELLVVLGEKDIRSVRPSTVGGDGYARLSSTVGGNRGGDGRLVERARGRGGGGRNGSFRGGDYVTKLAVVEEE